MDDKIWVAYQTYIQVATNTNQKKDYQGRMDLIWGEWSFIKDKYQAMGDKTGLGNSIYCVFMSTDIL
jgi:hypothetical protein